MAVIFILITSLILLYILFTLYDYWTRRDFYAAIRKFPGPTPLPLVGNALEFYGRNEEVLQKICNMLSKYETPIRFWLGPKLILCFTNPNHVEKILSSSKFAYKHELYDLVKYFLGEGLVSGSGSTYKKHRRIIQPLFNNKFCTSYFDVFQKHSNICVEKLENYLDKELFDIHHIIHKTYANVIGEMLLGINMGAFEGKNKDFIQSSIDLYDFGFTRLIKPWLHYDFIYNNTSYKRTGENIRNNLTNFMEHVLIESWQRRRFTNNTNSNKPLPIVDQIAEYIKYNPGSISSKDFVYHMVTLYEASEDTMSIISSALCVCLGMYPEYQTKVAKEIHEIFGDKPREITMEDIGKLNYLDMCIKEVMRLFPIAPYVLRRTLEDYQLDKWLIPKGAGIVIPIYNLHRSPSEWSNLNHFYPDHFLPEAVQKRHIYSFVPFSAGPRGCIGKIFANIGIKVLMASLLQRYVFEAEGKFPDFKIRMDISVRPINGYNLRLKKRIWN